MFIIDSLTNQGVYDVYTRIPPKRYTSWVYELHSRYRTFSWDVFLLKHTFSKVSPYDTFIFELEFSHSPTQQAICVCHVTTVTKLIIWNDPPTCRPMRECTSIYFFSMNILSCTFTRSEFTTQNDYISSFFSFKLLAETTFANTPMITWSLTQYDHQRWFSELRRSAMKKVTGTTFFCLRCVSCPIFNIAQLLLHCFGIFTTYSVDILVPCLRLSSLLVRENEVSMVENFPSAVNSFDLAVLVCWPTLANTRPIINRLSRT